MPSEAQKRADRKYKHDKTQQFCLRFYPGDSEIWGFLSAQDNKQGFLKQLISREMERSPVSVGAEIGLYTSIIGSDKRDGNGRLPHGEAVRYERVDE